MVCRGNVRPGFGAVLTELSTWSPCVGRSVLPPQWRPAAFSQALEDVGVRIAATHAFGVEDELPSGVRISVGGARSHAELSAALQKIQTLLGKSQIASSSMVV